jgi:hypothetical protein
MKKKQFKDGRKLNIYFVCRCVDCRELFLSFCGDFVCGSCDRKPELDNENRGL